jgi:hypothetical protein
VPFPNGFDVLISYVSVRGVICLVTKFPRSETDLPKRWVLPIPVCVLEEGMDTDVSVTIPPTAKPHPKHEKQPRDCILIYPNLYEVRSSGLHSRYGLNPPDRRHERTGGKYLEGWLDIVK